MQQDTQPRDELGKFSEREDSLHRKTIGLRISKSNYPKLIALAESMNIRPTELARMAVEEYLVQHWSKELNRNVETN